MNDGRQLLTLAAALVARSFRRRKLSSPDGKASDRKAASRPLRSGAAASAPRVAKPLSVLDEGSRGVLMALSMRALAR